MSNPTPERDERPDPTRPMPRSEGSPGQSRPGQPRPGQSGTGPSGPGTPGVASGPASPAPASGPASSGPATPAYAAPSRTATTSPPGAGREEQPEPEQVRGPYLATVLIGLVCLAVAGVVIAQEIGGLSIDWGSVGPLGIVAAGALLVVLGALGLLSSRRRR